MNRLSLKSKIWILVGILAGTVVAVAAVGGRQLSRTNAEVQQLVNVTSRATDLTSRLRIELLRAIRAEKNAVLTPEDARAVEFVQDAKARREEIDKLLPQLQGLLASEANSSERQQLEEFKQSWQAFVANQQEVLRLAAMNSNVKGSRLLSGEVAECLLRIGKPLEALQARIAQSLSTENASAEQLRRQREIEQLLEKSLRAGYRVPNLLFRHLASSDDSEMNQLDQLLSEQIGVIDVSLRELKPRVDEVDRSDVSQALAESESLQKLAAQVQVASRANTTNKSTQLTLTKTVELGNQCDGALERLLKLLSEQVEAGKDAVQLGYYRSLAINAAAAVVGILLGLILARIIGRSITEPVAQGVELAHALAAGDLTRRLGLTQQDELGQLTRAIDEAAENFAKIIAQVHDVSEEISKSSADLGAVSHQLLAQSEEMSTQAGFVAGSTEQMTANINTMAAAAEQMSMNVASISSASEEISVNVGTISSAAEQTTANVGDVVQGIQLTTKSFNAVSDDASEGAQISAQAAGLASTATQTMNALDRSAGEISKVTEMIKLIAMQTNLLALNATIEATSAGEAGKGFAVVAHEIKQLANQSGKAAEDIARMIEGIQTNTRGAVSVIQEVAETISSINTASARIYKAVEAQTKDASASAEKLNVASQGVEHIAKSILEVAKGTNDMSRNASEASQAANDVSHNASEAAKAVREISSNIHGVSEATQQNTASAQQVNQAAAQLQAIAGNLDRIVRHFRIHCEK